ncbi:MAG: AzlC family ABC transporter permease [Pseudobdellovibrionaceae bacterium]
MARCNAVLVMELYPTYDPYLEKSWNEKHFTISLIPSENEMNRSKIFLFGFREMLPIMTGAIPFGAVMGTVCSEKGLSIVQTLSMNFMVYAGAAQLAAMDLMGKHAASWVVVLTGLVINLRFLLYSAAMSPITHESKWLTKFLAAHTLTDQSFAVMSANQSKLKSNLELIVFYFGTATCMALTWQLSVICGYIFGNFAPASWALEYAVPLSFVALVIPTLKNKTYVIVATFSAVTSILLNPLPYRISLIVTALLSIALGIFLTRKKRSV